MGENRGPLFPYSLRSWHTLAFVEYSFFFKEHYAFSFSSVFMFYVFNQNNCLQEEVSVEGVERLAKKHQIIGTVGDQAQHT